MALLQQLSGTTTSTALMTGQTFPNVTQPHFEITGGFVDGMGGIMMALAEDEELADYLYVDSKNLVTEYQPGNINNFDSSTSISKPRIVEFYHPTCVSFLEVSSLVFSSFVLITTTYHS